MKKTIAILLSAMLSAMPAVSAFPVSAADISVGVVAYNNDSTIPDNTDSAVIDNADGAVPDNTDSAAVVVTATESGYTGAGMCIALLGSGFLTEHESFRINAEAKLSAEYVDSLPELNAQLPENQPDASFYISEKIPFAYNYADDSLSVDGIAYSGTALLYAAAGNPTELSRAPGVAPDAQILAMKIASDLNGKIDESAAARAVEDAVKLGADVICVAISDPCGFDDDSTELGEAIAEAEAAGIPVIAAVGDVGDPGKESVYYDAYAMSAPETTHPDTGMVSYPASLDEVLGVGSAHTNTLTAHCLVLPDGSTIPYSDSNHLYSAAGGQSFTEYFGGQTLEYVFVDRLGTPEDCAAAGNLEGKLAIIDRGDLTFVDKAKNAAARGAVGVIIRDNQPDPNQTLNLLADLTDSPIPLVIAASQFISLLDPNGGSLYVSPDKIYTVKLFDTPYPSDFSASGPTPDLALGPDVSYIAESVETLGSDGSYISASGTAVAAARLAGAFAVAKQRLLSEDPELTLTEAGVKARALLVSSAELMTQTGSSSTPYSPRLQGGGVVSVESLQSCGLILTSDGDYKIELGELGGRWLSFDLTVENLRDYAVDCALDFIVGSDGYREFSYSELAYDDGSGDLPLHERLGKQPDDRIAFTTDFVAFDDLSVYINDLHIDPDSEDGYEFRLGAGGEYTFDVTIYIGEDIYDEYRRVFENGFFAEGFARVRAVGADFDAASDSSDISDDTGNAVANNNTISIEDGTDSTMVDTATIPFIGFCGNWYEETALDADVYDHATPIIDGRWLYRNFASSSINSTVVLGTNPFLFGLDSNLPERELICYSPVADPYNEGIYLNFGLRRSVSDVRVTVTNSAGEVVYSADRGDCPRTYVNSNGVRFTAQLPLWNARAGDNRYYVCPDGYYKIMVSYHNAGSPNESSFTYTVYLDSVPPTINSSEFIIDREKALLKLDATDNYGIAYISISDSSLNSASLTDDGCYDIGLLNGKYIYVEVWDLALNSTMIRLDNPLYMDF